MILLRDNIDYRDNIVIPHNRASIGFILCPTDKTFNSDILSVGIEDVELTFSFKASNHIHPLERNAELELESIKDASAAITPSSDLDVVFFVGGCMSALVGTTKVLEAVRAGAPSAMVSSLYTATQRATRAVNAKRISVATSYDAKINALISQTFDSFGIEVLNCQSIPISNSLDFSSISKQKIRKFVLSLDRADADAIVICSTTVRAMETIEEIENIAGKPVLCSNQMAIWDALRSAGVSDRIDGYGSLLRDY